MRGEGVSPTAGGHHQGVNPSRTWRVLQVSQKTHGGARSLCPAEGLAQESGLCHPAASLLGSDNLLPTKHE